MLVLLLRPPLYVLCYRFIPISLLDDNVLPTPVHTATSTADWRLSVARAVFSWTLTECTLLFVFLMLQAADILSAHTRLINFQISLYALLAILLIVIPESTALVLLSTTSSPAVLLRSPRTLLSSLVPVLLSLLVLSYIPLSKSQYHEDFLTRTLSRLVVLGITILGLLSGFGAVTRAWDFLPFSSRKDVVPTEEEVRAAEMSLRSVRNDIQRRRDELERRNPPDSASSQGNWLSRMGDTLRGGDSLSLEIRGLEALEHSMSLNVSSLHSQRASAHFARTFRGRVWALVGRLFAGYCIVRVITAAYNLLFLRSKPQTGQTTTYPDIITNILIWLFAPLPSPTPTEPESPMPALSFTLTPEFIASLTRHVSLVLVGLIVLSSINVVMHGVNRALKITSRRLGTSLILLFLAYLMGIYLLSTLVQLRSSFPPPPPSPILTPSPAELGTSTDPLISTTTMTTTPVPESTNNLFTLIPAYELFNSLFDSSFLLSAMLTFAIRWGIDRLSMID